MTAPLEGVRVVEFGNLVAAPYCGMLLADMGADVVKVEPPAGDLAREIGPHLGGESAFFMAVNRGKRSLAVDLKSEEAKEWVTELCRRSDVLVHNLRGGAMERMGLGYQRLASANPGLIYAVISAFGSDGPDGDRPGIDLVFQGESGMMSIAGAPGDPPQKTATTIGDFVAGTNAALAICAALVGGANRERGRHLEISLRDGLIAVQAGWNALYFASGQQPERTGTGSPITGPNQTFATSDGHLNIAIVSDRHFALLCQVLDLVDLPNDRRFSTNQLRVSNRDHLETLLGAVFHTGSTDHWIGRLRAAGLPAGRILTLPEVFTDPQVLHNQMVIDFDHPRAGPVRTQGSPIKVDGTPAIDRRPPPVLGGNTAEVLADLGASKEVIRRLSGPSARA
jgi:crotonobetainyl-CoA:carnitine CoA-transferase CaiB-like acyl-CoA transferase